MAHSGWRVTSQATDQIENTDAGKTEVGVRIYFVTGDGNEGSIFVANRHYGDKKHVKNRLHAAAQQIDEIGALGSDRMATDAPDAF
jgi:hypothetical protein